MRVFSVSPCREILHIDLSALKYSWRDIAFPDQFGEEEETVCAQWIQFPMSPNAFSYHAESPTASSNFVTNFSVLISAIGVVGNGMLLNFAIVRHSDILLVGL